MPMCGRGGADMGVTKPILLEIVAVKVPPGEFRTPRVVVVRVVVRRLSGSRLDVSAPMAADGAAGVEMPADLWAEVESAALAAVHADGAAAVALMAGGRRPGRLGNAARHKRHEIDGEP